MRSHLWRLLLRRRRVFDFQRPTAFHASIRVASRLSLCLRLQKMPTHNWLLRYNARPQPGAALVSKRELSKQKKNGKDRERVKQLRVSNCAMFRVPRASPDAAYRPRHGDECRPVSSPNIAVRNIYFGVSHGIVHILTSNPNNLWIANSVPRRLTGDPAARASRNARPRPGSMLTPSQTRNFALICLYL